jgi:hypothetical protein
MAFGVLSMTHVIFERILREIRRRTRVVGAFPDGHSALNLAAAKLRHIAGNAWSTKRYLNVSCSLQNSGPARVRIHRSESGKAVIVFGLPRPTQQSMSPALREAVGNETAVPNLTARA